VPRQTLHGVASWYGQEFAGRTTANGEIFDPLLLTAAHRTLPFGTVVDVRNPKTGQTVRVRINDRGPFVGNRMIDLSYAAAQKIGLIEPGSGEVDVVVVAVGRGDREPPAPYVVEVPAPRTPVAAAEPPKVEFPLPAPGGAVTAAPEPDSGFGVKVVEERAGVETRRQVSPDGTRVEVVPVSGASGAETNASTVAPPAQVRRPPPAPPARRGERFFVQVGAFSVEANAIALRERLARIGQQSRVDHDEALYRVRIGPFATRDEALRARGTLEVSGISAIVVSEPL
jgi:rare lipoprotein A